MSDPMRIRGCRNHRKVDLCVLNKEERYSKRNWFEVRWWMNTCFAVVVGLPQLTWRISSCDISLAACSFRVALIHSGCSTIGSPVTGGQAKNIWVTFKHILTLYARYINGKTKPTVRTYLTEVKPIVSWFHLIAQATFTYHLNRKTKLIRRVHTNDVSCYCIIYSLLYLRTSHNKIEIYSCFPG